MLLVAVAAGCSDDATPSNGSRSIIDALVEQQTSVQYEPAWPLDDARAAAAKVDVVGYGRLVRDTDGPTFLGFTDASGIRARQATRVFEVEVVAPAQARGRLLRIIFLQGEPRPTGNLSGTDVIFFAAKAKMGQGWLGDGWEATGQFSDAAEWDSFYESHPNGLMILDPATGLTVPVLGTVAVPATRANLAFLRSLSTTVRGIGRIDPTTRTVVEVPVSPS